MSDIWYGRKKKKKIPIGQTPLNPAPITLHVKMRDFDGLSLQLKDFSKRNDMFSS